MSDHGWVVPRSVAPRADVAIRDAFHAGVPAAALAREYRVSVRTIYRAIKRSVLPVVVVRVGPWRAEFVISEAGPVRCTPWYADPEAAS